MEEDYIKPIDCTLSEDMKALMALMEYYEKQREKEFFEIFKISEENQGKPQAASLTTTANTLF